MSIQNSKDRKSITDVPDYLAAFWEYEYSDEQISLSDFLNSLAEEEKETAQDGLKKAIEILSMVQTGKGENLLTEDEKLNAASDEITSYLVMDYRKNNGLKNIYQIH